MLLVGSSMTFPAGKTPGQQRIPGIRIPPSQLVDLPAARETAKDAKLHIITDHLIFNTENNAEM